MMTDSTNTHNDPLIQTLDTTDVGVLHELRVLMCHWHET